MLNNNEYYILTPEDVMEELCIGRNAVYKLLNSGELKALRVGRNWKIPRKELNEFIDKKLKQERGIHRLIGEFLFLCAFYCKTIKIY